MKEKLIAISENDVAMQFDNQGKSLTSLKKTTINKIRHVETIRQLLHIPLEIASLQEQLSKMLEIVLDSNYLQISKKKAVVFLVDEIQWGGNLQLTAQKWLPPELINQCAKIDVGQCLCWIVAKTWESLFSSNIDEKHSITFPWIEDHGHHIVPIKWKNGHLLWVLNIDLDPWKLKSVEEEAFLLDITNCFAALIESHRERVLMVLPDMLDFNTKLYSFEKIMQTLHLLRYCCPDPDWVYIWILEMLINSIEHWMLWIKYKEKTALKISPNQNAWEEEVIRRNKIAINEGKHVDISYKKLFDKIIITINDHWEGFDPKGYFDMLDPKRMWDPHWRWIAMSNGVFSKMYYNKKWNEVTLEIDIPNKDVEIDMLLLRNKAYVKKYLSILWDVIKNWKSVWIVRENDETTEFITPYWKTIASYNTQDIEYLESLYWDEKDKKEELEISDAKTIEIFFWLIKESEKIKNFKGISIMHPDIINLYDFNHKILEKIQKSSGWELSYPYENKLIPKLLVQDDRKLSSEDISNLITWHVWRIGKSQWE